MKHIVILDYYIFLAFEIKKACLNLWVRERMEMDMKKWVWCNKPALENKYCYKSLNYGTIKVSMACNTHSWSYHAQLISGQSSEEKMSS